MKIAFFLSTSGHSGVDRSIALLIPELLSRGYCVDLVKIKKHGPYIENDSPNYRSIELPTAHTMTALGPLKRYLINEKPDVLLSDKDRANRVALLAKKFAKSEVEVVVSSGTIMSINLKNRSKMEGWFHMLSMNYLYKNARAVIVPSEEVADDLADISKIKRESISVVPLPILNSELIEKSNEAVDHPWLNAESELPVLISVGELCPRKDQSTLLRAFKKVSEEQPCRLLLLGKGKDKTKLMDLAKELKIENDVDFLGFQANPFAYMARSRLFIHTATFEGFGMVITEAMYLGVNVVATACPGGPREILANGKYGKLVPVADPIALAKAIKASLNEAPLPHDLLKDAVDKYTVKRSTDAYLEAMGLPRSAP